MFFGDDSERKVNREHRKMEPQQVFMDKLAAKREELSEKKFEVPVKKKKLWMLFAFFLLVMLLFLGKTFDYQVLDYNKFLALAEDNKDITHLVRANRGVIYDRDKKQLVSNKGSYDLVVYKRRLPDDPVGRDELVEKIVSVVDKKEKEIKKEIKKAQFNRVLVAKDLSHEQLILARTKLVKDPSIKISEDAVRNYEYGKLFAHIIGYTGKISQEELEEREDYSPLSYIGKSGLEKSYENVLKGTPGKERVKKDARGNFLSKELVKKPQSGNSLTLEVDKGLQEKSSEALKKILKESGSKKGVVIATDPQTGAILSMVSIPSFDANLFTQGITTKEYQKIQEASGDPLLNQAVSGAFPTGSIIKPLEATGGLEEETINSNTTVDCKGKIEVENRYTGEMQVFKDWTTHGVTDIKKAIAQSCNVFFYSVGGGHGDIEGLGPEQIKKWLQKFGWGSKTGIDLPSERKGSMPTFGKNWTLGDTYHFSIGQGYFAIPPLQVNVAFNAIANGGTLYQPRLVKKIIGKENEVKEKKVIRKNIASDKSLRIVKQGMKQTVESPNGTAHAFLNSLPVSAGAKTGTAQIGEKNHFHDWIVAFAPYEDPEIVLTVLVERVKGEQVTANFVGKDILQYYFKDENSSTTEKVQN